MGDMEYLYAAIILHRAKKEINQENISEVLTIAGIEVDPNKVKRLVKLLGNLLKELE